MAPSLCVCLLFLALISSSQCDRSESEAALAPGGVSSGARVPASSQPPAPPSCPYACCDDYDCTSRYYPYCDTYQHRCVECLDADECAPTADASCGATCSSSGFCGGGYDCTMSRKKCYQGSCVECTRDRDCSGSLLCNTRTNKCVQCLSSGDCTDSNSACGQTCDSYGRCAGGTDCTFGFNHLQCSQGHCVQCESSSDCARYYPSTPICDSGTCVECKYSSDCPRGSDQRCGSTCSRNTCTSGQNCDQNSQRCLNSQTCVDCLSTYDCPSTLPVCLTGSSYTCVECNSDMYCPKKTYCDAHCNLRTNQCEGSLVCPSTQKCLETESRCVDCFTKSDCRDPSKSYCDPKGACVECLSAPSCRNDSNCNAKCSLGKCSSSAAGVLNCLALNSTLAHCKTDSATCVECTKAAHCPTLTPFCIGNTCKQCNSDSDCIKFSHTPHCNSDTNMCVECNVNSDCRDDQHCDSTCNAVTHTCSELSANCTADHKVCDAKKGLCFECLSDKNCNSPTRPTCTAGTCSECSLDAHCRSNASCDATCDTSSLPYKCKNATKPLKCASPLYCETDAGLCIECKSDSECRTSKFGAKCDLKRNVCGECLQDPDCRDETACNATCLLGAHNKCHKNDSSVCAEGEQCQTKQGLCYSGMFCTSDRDCGVIHSHCSPLNNCTECLVSAHCESNSRCGFTCNDYLCSGGKLCDSGMGCNKATTECVECGIDGYSCGVFFTCSAKGRCGFQYLWLILPIGIVVIIAVIVFFIVKTQKSRSVRNYAYDEAQEKLLQGGGSTTDMATF